MAQATAGHWFVCVCFGLLLATERVLDQKHGLKRHAAASKSLWMFIDKERSGKSTESSRLAECLIRRQAERPVDCCTTISKVSSDGRVASALTVHSIRRTSLSTHSSAREIYCQIHCQQVSRLRLIAAQQVSLSPACTLTFTFRSPLAFLGHGQDLSDECAQKLQQFCHPQFCIARSSLKWMDTILMIMIALSLFLCVNETKGYATERKRQLLEEVILR